MDYLDDDFIEEQVSSAINFNELKLKLKEELKELQIAIEDKNKQKIKDIFDNINNFLNWYW